MRAESLYIITVAKEDVSKPYRLIVRGYVYIKEIYMYNFHRRFPISQFHFHRPLYSKHNKRHAYTRTQPTRKLRTLTRTRTST